MPCTTSRASSSSYGAGVVLGRCSGALRAATAGQITTSPSSSGGTGRRRGREGRGAAGARVREAAGLDERRRRWEGEHVGGAVVPMNRWLRSAMAASSTNSSDSSASPRDALVRAAPPRRGAASGRRRPGRSACSSATNTSRSPSSGSRRRGRRTGTARRWRAVEPSSCGLIAGRTSSVAGALASPPAVGAALVGVDDVLHDAVAHDVAAGEAHERQPVDAGEDLLEAEQARAPAGHVDLGDVAGDDGLGAEPDAGEEHLHLLGRGVLRLVEDDEAAVERAAAHERQRRDLDRAPLEQASARPRCRPCRRGRRRAGRR